MVTEAWRRESHRGTLPTARKLVLSVGFVALAVGAVLAWNAPATQYELSIYWATPLSAWIALSVAFAAAVLVCLLDPRDRLTGIGVWLAGMVTVTVASLPLIRNYPYYGTGDALTHLGWTKDLQSGLLEFPDLFYPGGHTISLVLAAVFGLETARAVLLMLTVLIAMYVLFVPLAARALVRAPLVTVIAAFSGFFLLPFFNVSTTIQFHAYSLGLMMLPAFLFVLIKQLMVSQYEPPRSGPGMKAALLLFGGLLLFAHPQVMLNVIILLGVIVFVHVWVRERAPEHPLRSFEPSYVVFVLLTTLWLVWSTAHWQLYRTAESVMGSAYMTLFGDETPGQTAAEVGVSASAIGVSLWEFYGKMLLVSSAYVVLTVLVGIVAIVASLRWYRRPDYSVITYVGCAGIVLVPFFLLHFLGEVSGYFFRHLGFALVVATILGSIGIYYHIERLSPQVPSGVLRLAGAVLLAAAVVLSVMLVYPSPWIYVSGSHVSDGEVSGYELAFEHANEELEWAGIGSGPGRFFDGLTPDTRPEEARGNSIRSNDALTEFFEGENDASYLPVSDRDIQREVIAYKELAFSAESLDRLDTTPGVNRIHANEDFNLYYMSPAATGSEHLAVDILDATSPTEPGESVEIIVEVANTGDVHTDDTIALTAPGGELIDEESVSLEAGESVIISIMWEPTSAHIGTHELTVASATDSDTVEVVVEEPPEPGHFDVAIEDTSDSVLAGSDLEVTTTIENTGDESDTQQIELYDFEGSLVDTVEVSLAGGETASVSLGWTTTDADIGTGEITVESANTTASHEVTVEEPANFALDILGVRNPILAGQEATVDVAIRNDGTVGASETVELIDDTGSVVDSATVELGGGETTETTLTWETGPGDAGDRELTVAGSDDEAGTTVEVRAPAHVSVAIIDTNSPVEEGEQLHVDVRVENDGDEATSQQIELRDFDGTLVDTTSVSLAGGESTTVRLSWQTDDGDVGTGDIHVSSADDEDRADVEVEEESGSFWPFG